MPGMEVTCAGSGPATGAGVGGGVWAGAELASKGGGCGAELAASGVGVGLVTGAASVGAAGGGVAAAEFCNNVAITACETP